MYSKRLQAHGLINKVAGSAYNFRSQKIGEAVKNDVNRLVNELGIHPTELYSAQQKHTAHIEYADGTNGEPFLYGRTFKDTDGLITDKKNMALLIKFADCTPVVLYDPERGVQATVHSGWRGTCQRISLQAIEKMEKEFHCQKENILVYLGPSIDQENYEVGSEVYDAFYSFSNKDSFFKPKGDKYVLDMLEANLSIIKEAGIPVENIEMEKSSTYTDSRLHSARKEGSDYQLNALLTLMK